MIQFENMRGNASPGQGTDAPANARWGNTNPRNSVLVPLTRGMTTIIDADDASLVLRHSWRWKPSGNRIGSGYAATPAPRQNGQRGPDIMLHRLILDVPSDKDVDHINRDSLDNRKINLRIASRSQNVANSTPRVNRLGFRGVRFDRRSLAHPYSASICVNYQRIIGPRRATVIEAARDYDDLARKYFGEFASLNFQSGNAS